MPAQTLRRSLSEQEIVFVNDFLRVVDSANQAVRTVHAMMQSSVHAVSETFLRGLSPFPGLHALDLLSKVKAINVHSFTQIKPMRRMTLHAGIEMKFLAAI